MSISKDEDVYGKFSARSSGLKAEVKIPNNGDIRFDGVVGIITNQLEILNSKIVNILYFRVNFHFGNGLGFLFNCSLTCFM